MIRNTGRAYVDSKPPAASYDFKPLNPQVRQDMQTETSSYGKQEKLKMRRSPTNIKTNPKFDNKKPSPNASLGSEGSGGSGTGQRSRPRSLVILGTTQTSRRPKADRSDLSLSSRDLNSPGRNKDGSPILPNPAHELDPCLILSTPELRKKCAQGLTSPDMTHMRKVTKPKNRSVSLDKLQRQHQCFKLGGQRCCKCTLQVYRTGSMANVSKQKKNQENYDSKNILPHKSRSVTGTGLVPDRNSNVVPEKNVTKCQPNGTHKPFLVKSPGLEKLDLSLTLPYYMSDGVLRSRTAMAPVNTSAAKPKGHAINHTSNANTNKQKSNYRPVREIETARRKYDGDETKLSTGEAESSLSESQVSSFFKPSPTVWKTPIMKGNKERFMDDPNLDKERLSIDNRKAQKHVDGNGNLASADTNRTRIITPKPLGKVTNEKEEKGTAEFKTGKHNETNASFITEPLIQKTVLNNSEINSLPLKTTENKYFDPRTTTADHTPRNMKSDSSTKVDAGPSQKIVDAESMLDENTETKTLFVTEPLIQKTVLNNSEINSLPLKITENEYFKPRTTTADHTPRGMKNDSSTKVDAGPTQIIVDVEYKLDNNTETKTPFVTEPLIQKTVLNNSEINSLSLNITGIKYFEPTTTTADHTPSEIKTDSPTKVDAGPIKKIENVDKIKYSKSSQEIGSIPENSTSDAPRTETLVTVAGSAMPVDKYLSMHNDLGTPKFVNSEISINKTQQEEDDIPPFGDTSNSWPRKRPSTPTNKRVAGFQYDSEEDKLIVQSLLARYAAHGSLATSGLSRADMTDYLNTVKKQLGLDNEIESKQQKANEEPANKSDGSQKDETDNEKPPLIGISDEGEPPSLPERERILREKSAEKRVIEKEDIDVFSQTTFHVDGEITNSPVVRRRVLVAELGRKKFPGSALDDDDENNNDGHGPVYSNAEDESTCQGIRSGDIIYTRMVPAYDLWTRTGGFHGNESIPEELLELGITEDQFQRVVPLLNECILYKQLESTLKTWLSGCYFAVVFLLLWALGFAVCYLGNTTGLAPGLIFVVAVLLVLVVAGTFQLTKRLTASRFQHSVLAVNRELSPCDILLSVTPAGYCGTALAVNFVFFDCLPCQKILLLSIKDKAAENRLLTQISQKHPHLMEVISQDLEGISTKPATVGRKIILSDIMEYFAPSFLESFLYKKGSKKGKAHFGGLRGSTLEFCEFIRQQGLGEILKGVSEKHSRQTLSQIKQNTRKFTKI